MKFPLIKNANFGTKLLSFALLLIFGLLFSSVLGIFISSLRGGSIMDATNLQITQICNQVVGFLMPPVLYVMLVHEQPFNYMGFNKFPTWSLLGVVAIYAVLPFNGWIAEWNENIVFPEALSALEAKLKAMHELYGSTSDTLMEGSSLALSILIFGLLAAVSEEVLFRSVIQKALVSLFKNAHIGILVTAIIFSAFHMDFFGFFPRFIYGLLLGYMFWLSGSIWSSILMHFVNNSVITVLEFYKIDSESFGQTDNAIVIILSLIVTVAIFIACNRLKNKTEQLIN